jgi:hypothetical protein
MSEENFPHQQVTSPSWHMLERNVDELVKVNFVNLAALAVSWSEFDQWIRTAGLVAALVYTIVKTVQTVQEIKARKSQKND